MLRLLLLSGICSLLLTAFAGCGKGRTGRLSELSAPPKPSPDQIAQTRRQTFGVEEPQAPSSIPQLPPLQMFMEWGVRQTATDSLARIGLPAMPALIDALRDPSADVRDRAAQALARIGPPARQAVPSLIDALNDPDWRVRRSAARALGQIGPAAEEAVPALIEVIRDPAYDRGAPPGAATEAT